MIKIRIFFSIFLIFFLLSCSKSYGGFSVSCDIYILDIKMATRFVDVDFNKNKVFEKIVPTDDGVRFENYMKENMGDIFFSVYKEADYEYQILESDPAYVVFTRTYAKTSDVKHRINRVSLEYTTTTYTYNEDGSLMMLDIPEWQNPVVDTIQCFKPQV